MENIGKKLRNDPRILQAKQLIFDAIKEHKNQIKNISAPKKDNIEEFNQLISHFSEMRGSDLWYPYIGSGIGNGSLVELLDGSIKYDFITGIGVHYFGHSHPLIIDAAIEAALSNTIMQGHLQQNEESVLLTELLLKASKLDCCFLTTSGAMANENALKIAFQKNYPANRILAFEHCFAGRTLAISQITDKPLYRMGLPLNYAIDYIPFFDYRHPKESIENSVRILKNHLERYPSKHAAMIFELILGEGGFYPGTREFFSKIMEILKEHEIVIISDEVQTFGRTSQLFAFQHFALEKFIDIVTIGKLSQVCATIYKKELKPKAGLLSQTFTASTSMIFSSYFIIKELLENKFFGPEGKIQKTHQYFEEKFKELEEKYPTLIEGPWGIGAMVAFTPYKGNRSKVLKFTHDLFDAGVISFIAGENPTRVRFLVPMGTITYEDIDHVMAIIEDTLKNGVDDVSP